MMRTHRCLPHRGPCRVAFTSKKIDLAFQLNNGKSFAGTSSNILTLSGLRVAATIVKAGGAGMTVTRIRAYGLSQSVMNQLSTYGAPPDFASSAAVQVSAGDAESGMSVASIGSIQTAIAEYSGAPEVAFDVTAYTGLLHAILPGKPTSINGSADCAQIMQQLATTMGYQFENSGVSVQLSHPYFSGSARTQAQECAEAGDFNWIIDDDTLAIWPKGGARKGTVVLVSPETGMVGFPRFMLQGVVVKTLYNPSVRYGSVIKVDSSLQPACGLWGVTQMVHELTSETPGGDWFTTMQALSTDFVENINAGASK